MSVSDNDRARVKSLLYGRNDLTPVEITRFLDKAD